MALDRISRLVHLAAADSGVLSALHLQPAKLQVPLNLSDDQVRLLQSASSTPTSPATASSPSSTKQDGGPVKSAPVISTRQQVQAAPAPVAKADMSTPDTGDELLPPEGTGQPPIPVLIALPPLPVPAPSRSPVPQPTPAPESRPAPSTSPAIPAPFRAPLPLGPMPWQPGPAWFGQGPMGPLPGIPVLRQPQPVAGWFQPCGGPGISVPENPTCYQEETPCQTTPRQAPFASWLPQSAERCDCCLQVTALVATVTTTSQTAITGITAIAQQR
jgi:hypothetical protein